MKIILTNVSRQKLIKIISLLLLIFFATSGVKAQLIKDVKTLANMQLMFVKQQQLAAGRNHQLFDIFNAPLTPDEKQALGYLYTYMPLSDLADYNGDFFLQQVKSVLKARTELPWGITIPEEIFLHYVLPARINNENLDQFRIVMYDEIKNRVAGMSMHDAALEVNHWCHEKMTYRGSDDRTSSPLASLKTSFGRCGEESTFTVTALRTVGIPARQVYTPRWAHSDDNHAWVEVWIDGKWHFLGACEPDAELDMGWFAEPARRAMLVHTRAYGAYTGHEPVIDNKERFAELNLIQNYAPAKSIFVKVLTPENKAVANANVEYRLYNYAEFYPIAKGITNEKGINSIITGLGDLLIWAYEGEKWGYKKISVDKTDTATVVITDTFPTGFSEKFDLIPPVEKTPLPSTLPQNERDHNTLRLQQEDSIRTVYMSTFRDSVWVAGFASQQGLSAGRLMPVFRMSYGNWQEIADFISGTATLQKDWALHLLESISEKDLRDTKADILKDHLENSLRSYNSASDHNKDFFARYIMSGRISNEMMLPWRSFIQRQFNQDFVVQFKSDVNTLVKWVIENIKIDNIANLHSRAPLSPRGVYELKTADKHSRNIFFVAVCRSFGQAARINPATQLPQYFSNGAWQNVIFEPATENITEKGNIHFIHPDRNFDPKYAINFTIARYSGGVFRTIEFDYGMKISEFDAEIEVEAGKYLLVTGNRQPDGSVLSSVNFFEIQANRTTDITVEIRKDFTKAEPWAKINPAAYKFSTYSGNKSLSLGNLAAEKGAILIWIDPDKEPSKHVLADIPAVNEIIGKWGGGMLFLFGQEKVSASFKPANFPNLPLQSIFAYDKGLKLLTEVERLRKRKCSQNLPVIIIMDRNNNLIYYSEGYKIGIGEQIAKSITPLK